MISKWERKDAAALSQPEAEAVARAELASCTVHRVGVMPGAGGIANMLAFVFTCRRAAQGAVVSPGCVEEPCPPSTAQALSELKMAAQRIRAANSSGLLRCKSEGTLIDLSEGFSESSLCDVKGGGPWPPGDRAGVSLVPPCHVQEKRWICQAGDKAGLVFHPPQNRFKWERIPIPSVQMDSKAEGEASMC